MSVLYVAEMGSQHKGNIALACEYARQFAEAGADIIKMQFGRPETDPIRYVSSDMAETMQRYCLGLGLELMASIFSAEGLALARRIGMKRYKVAHQMVGKLEIVNAILADGMETFMSFTDRASIGRLPAHARVIYCTEQYPTYPWDLTLPARFAGNEVWHGYSDHTLGLGACLLAVGRGARYIEKHVALDKPDLWTKDTPMSATPDEFADLVRLGRDIERVRDAAL